MIDPVDTATLQTWLAQAQTALHQLRIGGNIARLHHGTKEITYTQTSLPALAAYVAELRTALGLPGGRANARRIAF